MAPKSKKQPVPDSPAKELERELMRQHGAVIGGDALRRHLGFASVATMQKAFRRGQLDVPAFEMPPRRGHFVLASDLAEWLVNLRRNGTQRAMLAKAVPGGTS